ncbi:MAG: hypothetical protein ACLUG9_06140 [Paraclostridium sordellii]
MKKLLISIFIIVACIMLFPIILNKFGKVLLVEDIPNTDYQLEVKSMELPIGIVINIKSNSYREELIKYPISQELRNIVKDDLEFKWKGETGILRVHGQVMIAEFKIHENKETHAFDYEVKTYKNN